MLVFETLKNKNCDFLDSNMCFCLRLYGIPSPLFIYFFNQNDKDYMCFCPINNLVTQLYSGQKDKKSMTRNKRKKDFLRTLSRLFKTQSARKAISRWKIIYGTFCLHQMLDFLGGIQNYMDQILPNFDHLSSS